MPFDSAPVTSPEIEGLEKLYDLLKDPNRWTKRTSARNSANRAVTWDSDNAYSFCVTGAINKLGLSTDFYDLLGFPGMSQVQRWNDRSDTTHAKLLNRIQKAINAQKAKILL